MLFLHKNKNTNTSTNCVKDSDCPNGTCKKGVCICVSNCDSNSLCGSIDNCGNQCQTGICTQPNHTCNNGVCTCIPNCKNNTCGDDGCGGTCNCPSGYGCAKDKNCYKFTENLNHLYGGDVLDTFTGTLQGCLNYCYINNQCTAVSRSNTQDPNTIGNCTLYKYGTLNVDSGQTTDTWTKNIPANTYNKLAHTDINTFPTKTDAENTYPSITDCENKCNTLDGCVAFVINDGSENSNILCRFRQSCQKDATQNYNCVGTDSDNNYDIYYRTDFPKNTYTSTTGDTPYYDVASLSNVKSVRDCQDLCDVTSECSGFVIDDSNTNCWLKKVSTVTDPNASNLKLYSKQVNNIQSQFSNKITGDIDGNDIDDNIDVSHTGMGVNECMKTCLVTDGCAAIVMTNNGQTCSLKKSLSVDTTGGYDVYTRIIKQ